MLRQLKPAILVTIVLTVLTGIVYPLAITGISQVVFKEKADGSMVTRNGRQIGSRLIGQNFTKPEYFHPRPSATGNTPYDPTSSGGSNLGPTNPALTDRLKKAAADFRKENPEFTGAIPADAITTSASGLDPEISPANAMAQSTRVAKARGVSPELLRQVVSENTHDREFGLLGEPRVNVLALNMALDERFPVKR